MANYIKKNWLMHLTFLAYIVLIAIVIYYHEPWADEAQAWLLARDSSLFGLLFKNLHYEGHPPLWHLILMLPAKLLPYRSISVISALIAIAGVYVFLNYSPFPRPIRILLPFTYFIFYQYAVIARNYVLLPLLFFLIARIYKNKTEKIYQFTILLCLLANASIFTTLVALSIMFIHLIDLIGARKELSKKLVYKQIKAYIIFAAAIALIVIQLWQPQDASFAKNYNFSIKSFLNLSPKIWSESMTEISYVSLFAMVVSLVWFWQSRLLLLYLLSTLSVLGLFSVKYYNSWHQGILFLIWVFAMWISLEDRDNRRLGKVSGYTEKLVILLLVVVFGIQIYWSGAISVSDYYGTYSAGKATADYIKDNKLEGKKIYATTFWTTAVQPYFKENIFANHNNGQKPSFWLWSTKSARMEDINVIIKEQPDLIIIGRPDAALRNIPGYRFVGIYEGNLYWKNGLKEKNDFGLFRKSDN